MNGEVIQQWHSVATRFKILIFRVLDFALYSVANINLPSLLIECFHRRNLANNVGSGGGPNRPWVLVNLRKSRVRKTGKIGFNQCLTHIHPLMFIGPCIIFIVA